MTDKFCVEKNQKEFFKLSLYFIYVNLKLIFNSLKLNNTFIANLMGLVYN